MSRLLLVALAALRSSGIGRQSRRCQPSRAALLVGAVALALVGSFGPARAASSWSPSLRSAPPASVGKAADAGAVDATARVSLVGQDAWTPLGGDLHVQLRVDGAGPDFSVSVVAHQALASRSAFERSLGGTSLGSVLDQVIVPLDALATNSAGNLDLVLGLEVSGGARAADRLGARRAGVYPLEIELRDAGDRSRSRVVTYLVVAAPAGSTGSVAYPLGVAWVWPLTAAPASLVNGAAEPRFLAQLRPDGRLGRQVAALRRSPDVPITVVPGPETVQTWAALARDDPTLTDGVAALQQALGTDQMVAGPYVPLDIPSLLRAGMATAVDAELVEGDEALRRFFGARLDTRTALGRPVDTAAFARLRADGIDRVVVDAGAVARSSRLTLAHPFKLVAPPSLQPGGPATAIAADTDLARLLVGDESPGLRAQRFLAALSVVALEQPDQARAVAVVNAADFNPPDTLLDAVLGGLRANPFVRPMTVDGVFEQIPAETTSDGSAVTHELASYDPPAPPVSAARFDAAEVRLTAFRGLAPSAPSVPAAQRSLLASLSSAWNGVGGGARARAEILNVDGTIDSFLTRIHAPNRSTITLTSRSGDIPLTFRNDTGQSVNVLVELQSPKLSFPDGAQRIVNLPPKNTTVRFAVEARTSGSFPLRLILRSTDGALTIAQASFRIEANAVSVVGLVLIVSAAVFLALWWLIYIRRERRRRRMIVEPAE